MRGGLFDAGHRPRAGFAGGDELRRQRADDPLNSLIERAFSERASDIHLEPQDGEMVVRMRIDGLLRRVLTVPSELQSTVISRLKIMGSMNIAEHIAASLTLRGWSPRRSVWS